MVLSDQIKNIFQKVQMTSAAHRRYINALVNLYKNNDLGSFLSAFEPLFAIIIKQYEHNILYTKRCLSFVSQFCVASQDLQRETTENILYKLLDLALKFTHATAYNIRHHAAMFIALLLQDVGERIEIEEEALDKIQEAMIRIMQDPKVPIRLQAISALIRLQDPGDMECPVILAYKEALRSTNSRVRSEVLKHIAPNQVVLNDIKLHVYDVDSHVRAAAFRKCAEIGPFVFKIIDKHKILRRGFYEDVQSVKNVFKDYCLSKWLTAFEGNFLSFIKSLKLNADEADMEQFKDLSALLIENFLCNNSLDEIVAVLPFENQVIKYEELNNEISMFWCVLVKLLMESKEHNDHWKEVLLPELTELCIYIERFVKEKFTVNLDEWLSLQYQFDVLNLFEISEHMDFSDEVGRQTMKKLSMSLLQNHHFNYFLTKKLVFISEKCSNHIETFTDEMCELIAGIVKPKLIDQPLSKSELLHRNFKIAEMKVKINVLEDSQRGAIEKRDYHTAGILEIDLKNSRAQLESLQKQTEEPTKNMRTEVESICNGLDVLTGVLQLVKLEKMTAALNAIRDTFIEPLLSHTKADICYRVLKCLALMGMIDIEIAKKYYKFISIPFTQYSETEPINKSFLITSISGISDLLSTHGEEVLANVDETEADSITKQTRMNGTTHTTINGTTMDSTNQMTFRRLYKTGDGLMTTYLEETNTMSSIYEQLLKILDDENEEIRFTAAVAITAFFKSDIPVTPFLLSRVIIKWFSPLTEKDDNRIQYCFGKTIEEFIYSKKSGDVFKAALEPTLLTIINAPKTSPLSEISPDNVVAFLAEVFNVVLRADAIKILILDIQMKIIDKPQDKITGAFVKLLHRLDIDHADTEGVKEVRRQSRMMLEVLPNKVLRRSVHKMLEKLSINDIQTVILEVDETNTTRNHNIDQLQNSSLSTQSSNGSNMEQTTSEPVVNSRKRKRPRRSKRIMDKNETIIKS